MTKEFLEKLKNAKSKEEIGILLKEADKSELSADDHEGVTGGVPEVFIIGEGSITPDELYQYTRAIHDQYGASVAQDFWENMLIAAGYERCVTQAIEAYRIYGNNMWLRLEELGWTNW